MHSALDQRDMLLAAWRTNDRVTVFLIEHLPHELCGATVPGAPRRTVRMIAGHIHNARCMWIKTLGKEHGIAVPRAVNRHKVGPKELIPALGHSSRGIISLLTLGCDRALACNNIPEEIFAIHTVTGSLIFALVLVTMLSLPPITLDYPA
jgi:hypothetical protein